MNGTLHSLCDWLADQLAEVRHASPLAVLTVENRHAVAPMPETVTEPAERLSAPVGLVSLADMPDVDATPHCQVELILADASTCSTRPVAILRAAHTFFRCGPLPVLVCGTHLCEVNEVVEGLLSRPHWCAKCHHPVACVHDLLVSTVWL